MLDSETIVVLVKQAQSGCKNSMNDLFTGFRDSAFKMACKRTANDPHEAEEVTQKSFIWAMLKLQSLKNPERFAGWLKVLIHNVATRHMQTLNLSNNRWRQVVDDDTVNDLALTEEEEHEPGKALSIAESMNKIGDESIILGEHYFRGKSIKTLASELQVPIGTVKSRLHTARKKLKKVLQEA